MEWEKDKIQYPKKTYETLNATELMLHVQYYGSITIQELSLSYLRDGFGCEWQYQDIEIEVPVPIQILKKLLPCAF